MPTYQISPYNTDGDALMFDTEVIFEADSDADATAQAQQFMADHPGWIGSLNRVAGRRHEWVADIHDAGQRVDTVNDGYDVAVNGAPAA